MQTFAYGFLCLKPDEFWSLTLTEFNLIVKGFEMKEELAWRKQAQLAAWIMSPHLKRPMSADKLLKKKITKKTTQEKSKKVVNELKDEFGIE
ncbi:phage tail assembly chaperone [Cytobacillus sp. Hm23]